MGAKIIIGTCVTTTNVAFRELFGQSTNLKHHANLYFTVELIVFEVVLTKEKLFAHPYIMIECQHVYEFPNMIKKEKKGTTPGRGQHLPCKLENHPVPRQ